MTPESYVEESEEARSLRSTLASTLRKLAETEAELREAQRQLAKYKRGSVL